jgi:hypothetical protein
VIFFSWFLWHDISLFIPTCCLSYSSSHKFFYTLYTGYKVRECYSWVRSLFQLQSHSGEHYLESNCFAPVIAFSSGLRFSWWLIVENFNQFMQYFNQLYFVFLNTIESLKMTDIFVCFSFWQKMGYMISGTGLMTELGK